MSYSIFFSKGPYDAEGPKTAKIIDFLLKKRVF